MKNIVYAGIALIAGIVGFVIYRFAIEPQVQTSVDAAQLPEPVAKAPEQLAAPDRLPEFTLTDQDGNARSIQSWPGKSLIINFWATWCAPCRREIPLLKQIQDEHEAEGFHESNCDNVDLDGANISPDRLNLYTAYASGPFDARLAARFYFEREFDGQPPANDFEGYTLLDAAAGYRFGKHRLSLSVMNLLDKRYITYFSDTRPATGSNISDTTFFAGRGRTFTLGLASEF